MPFSTRRLWLSRGCRVLHPTGGESLSSRISRKPCNERTCKTPLDGQLETKPEYWRGFGLSLLPWARHEFVLGHPTAWKTEVPSNALEGLRLGLEEICNLMDANPTPRGGLPRRPDVVRAINRSGVVLLCSHLERYIRAVNEEAIQHLNRHGVPPSQIPERMRLVHSARAIDDLARAQWDNRAGMLAQFSQTDAWLWGQCTPGKLEHARVLRWMRTPNPEQVQRFYGLWGVENIFAAITRASHTRTLLRLKIKELVEKRNNIAHGDFTVEATSQDVASYIRVVRTFCGRADRRLSRQLGRLFSACPGW